MQILKIKLVSICDGSNIFFQISNEQKLVMSFNTRRGWILNFGNSVKKQFLDIESKRISFKTCKKYKSDLKTFMELKEGVEEFNECIPF